MDTNKYEVILTDIAREDLEEIYEYISKYLLEPVIAKKLMNKIEQRILKLEENPYMYEKVRIKYNNDVYRKLVVDNYIVLYKAYKSYNQVVVYRVIYGRIDYLKIMEN